MFDFFICLYFMGDSALKTSVLNLESLELQFKNTLVQYEKAYLNYINTLNNISGQKYTILPSMTYWGSASLSQSASPNVEECQALCSSSSKCSGATYNSDKGMCFLRTGLGKVNTSTANNTAIITQIQHSIQEVSALNQELIRLNNEIKQKINGTTPVIEKEATAVAVKQGELRKVYDKLLQDKLSIMKTMDDISRSSQDYQDTSIVVTQNNIYYTFWFILAIIVVFITIKMIISEGTKPETSFSSP